MELSESIARKVLETVDQGLCKGLGQPKKGAMCVEAAVCYAMGMPHGDKPPCVGAAVRAYKIRLNDANWPSNEERAKGLRRVAIAQLGSDQIDQKAFAAEVTIQVVRQILPIALRAAAKAVPTHAKALKLAAVGCEAALTLAQAREAAVAGKAAADAAADAAAYSAATAAAAADAAADAAAYAAADSAAYADAAADSAANAAAYAYAYADSAANADAKKDVRLAVLRKAAEIGVQALIKLGAKGADWLFLTEEA